VHGALLAHVPSAEVDELVQDVFLAQLVSLDCFGAGKPERFDPASMRFAGVAGREIDGHYFRAATPISDGRMLIAGG